MMSLAEISLGKAVKQQYGFKIRAYGNLFVSLMAVQLIALLFTAGGATGMSGMGWDNIYIEVRYYSGTMIFVFTALWIAVNSFMLTLPLFRNIDFSFVTNRISSNLANIGFMITAAVAGGGTAALGSILLRNILYYLTESGSLIGANFMVAPGELFIGIVVGMLYLLLFSAVGYFVGALLQLHRSLYVLVPALLLGVLLYDAAYESALMLRLIEFFSLELSPLLFVLKIAGAVLLLWTGAGLISNRAEIR